MPELFSRLESSDVVGAIFFMLVFAAGMAVWFSLQWRLQRRTEMEVALKREMLEMGMSAEDIERVLKARLGESADSACQREAISSRRAGSLR
jgi:hypothetical protein